MDFGPIFSSYVYPFSKKQPFFFFKNFGFDRIDEASPRSRDILRLSSDYTPGHAEGMWVEFDMGPEREPNSMPSGSGI